MEGMVKRPWSPGPWRMVDWSMYGGNFWANFDSNNRTEAAKTMKYDIYLASKAPEFAEIAIRLVKPTGEDFCDLLADAAKLLKECGWREG